MDVEEGNKLIAEFMGHSLDDEGYYDIPQTTCQGYFDKTIPCNLEYNSSWDWLMPVVEKIEEDFGDYLSTSITGGRCFITNHLSVGPFKNMDEIFEDSSSKIEATYDAVVKFIKRYNEKNK